MERWPTFHLHLTYPGTIVRRPSFCTVQNDHPSTWLHAEFYVDAFDFYWGRNPYFRTVRICFRLPKQVNSELKWKVGASVKCVSIKQTDQKVTSEITIPYTEKSNEYLSGLAIYSEEVNRRWNLNFRFRYGLPVDLTIEIVLAIGV